MPKLLHFDPFNGASGDMILGALLDMGLPLSHLQDELGKLNLGEPFELLSRQISRQGVVATNFQVRSAEHADHHHGRHLKEIGELLDNNNLDRWVRDTSLKIFQRLAEAEARVHGRSPEDVHFHEVGGLDSIIDIVGACIGFQYFGVESFYTGPISLGAGTVTFSHGSWPVPAPATAALVEGFPVLMGPVEGELTTPTGAAIVTTLAQVEGMPSFSLETSGFGAGDREPEGIPNVLRLLLGEDLGDDHSSLGIQEEEVLVLEANIDNMDAEMVGHFIGLALRQGALDAYCAPLQMKKGRPGFLLTILCQDRDRERLAELTFRETTTLGIRWSRWRRWVLDREMKEVDTEFGVIRVKIARFRGQVVNVWPEYEDLRKIAEATGTPLKVLRQIATSQISGT